jgi:hypothetical protein
MINITSIKNVMLYLWEKNVLLTWYIIMYLTILIQGVIVYCYLCPYITAFPYR